MTIIRVAPRDSRRSVAPARSGSPSSRKARLDDVLAGERHLLGHVSHGLIRAFDARAVCEDDEAGHTWIREEALSERVRLVREMSAQVIDEGASARPAVVLKRLDALEERKQAKYVRVADRRGVFFG